MELSQLREQIDQTDDVIVQAFTRRMEIAAQIAACKKENNLPVFVPQREQEKLADVAAKAGSEMERYTRALYCMLFELSRSYQSKCNCEASPLYNHISKAIAITPEHFPASSTVAYLDGMHSSVRNACSNIFTTPNMQCFSSVEDMFQAIELGHCRYGILPVKNGNGEFVHQVYHLMVHHGFYIVASLGLPGEQTQYICISKELEIYPGSHKTAIMMVLPNQSDALYRVLTRLYILGIHVAKLETCPTAYGNLSTAIYFELEISVLSDEFAQLLCELDQLCDNFQYLGSFCEVV